MQSGASWEGLESPEVSASLEPDSTPPAPENFHEEREELKRVLSHPEFSRSANLVRFLSYICNKYFDGQTDDIREYSIAVEALGRRESNFDSHIDPIVRVTARSLRKKLRELYKTDWKDHPLQIVLPLGHYVPQFLQRDVAAQLAEDASLDLAENDNSLGVAQNSARREGKSMKRPAGWIVV